MPAKILALFLVIGIIGLVAVFVLIILLCDMLDFNSDSDLKLMLYYECKLEPENNENEYEKECNNDTLEV